MGGELWRTETPPPIPGELPGELAWRRARSLRQGRWLTPEESGEKCLFLVGQPGTVCLRCKALHAGFNKLAPKQAEIEEAGEIARLVPAKNEMNTPIMCCECGHNEPRRGTWAKTVAAYQAHDCKPPARI